MLNLTTLRDIERTLDFRAMVDCVTMQAILHTTKPNRKNFRQKCERKFAKLCGESPASATYAMQLLLAADMYEQRIALSKAGLGGCTPLTFSRCLQHIQTKAVDAAVCQKAENY